LAQNADGGGRTGDDLLALNPFHEIDPRS